MSDYFVNISSEFQNLHTKSELYKDTFSLFVKNSKKYQVCCACL